MPGPVDGDDSPRRVRSVPVAAARRRRSGSAQKDALSADGTLRSVSLLDRITVDAEVCHGAPTVRGLRYPVEMLIGLLASGMSTDEVLADYADLEADDVLAALVTRTRSSLPISAA